MAIQFLCPHCSATITVPNSSHGKRGSCPACKKKLIVPRPIGDPPATRPASPVATGIPAAVAQVATAVAPTAVAATAVAAPVPVQMPHSLPNAPAPVSSIPVSSTTVSSTTVGSTPVGSPPVGSPPVATTPTALVPEAPKSIAASMSRKRRKRSSHAAFSIGIPVGCFVIFVAVMAAIFWTSQPELKGTISGAILPDFNLPVTTLSMANLQLNAEESDTAATEFDQRPERFISAMMKCSIGADGRQMTVEVVPAEGYEWFTVNPSSDANLQDWAKKNSEAWNTKRKTNMQQVATDLCREKLKRAAGEQVVIDAARYRDEFALATLVKGFGYLVEAIAGSQRAVCAHEDANGTLYFSLPKDTESFILQGRSFDKQPPIFPGSYTVKILQAEEPTENDSANTNPANTETSSEPMPPKDDDVPKPIDSDDSFEDLKPPSMGSNDGQATSSLVAAFFSTVNRPINGRVVPYKV